jgi:hypothetical protein
MGFQGNFLRNVGGPRYLRSAEVDYLRSANGVFILLQQSDGNLVLYHGTDPGNPRAVVWATDKYYTPNLGTYLDMQGDGNLCNYANLPETFPLGNRISLWCSNTPVGGGEYIALLENTGNFKLCRGSDPTNPGPLLWETGVRPPLSRIEMRNVDYDLDRVVLTDPDIQHIVSADLENDSDETQTVLQRVAFEYTTMSSWQAEIGVSVGVEAEMNTGIPFIVEGKVTIGVELSFKYTWNTMEQKTKSIDNEYPVSVPPHSTIRFRAILYSSQISVPYTADITYYYQSGVSVSTTTQGMFRGSSESSLDASWDLAGNLPPLP